MTDNLADYNGPDRVIPAHELQESLTHRMGDEWYVTTDMPTLNNHITGFFGSEVTVITGPTKNGKTLFAQTLTDTFSRNGTKCLWFSYEVANRQFFAQFGEDLPDFYLPKELRPHAMRWLETRVREGKQKFGCKIVFIDHLHYLIDLAHAGSSSLHIGSIMRQLIGICKELDLHIFLVVHDKKVSPDKDGTFREPGVGDTRDSSLIEQEANNTIAIWRSDVTDNKARIKIIHNRRFGVRNKKFDVYKDGPYLTEDKPIPKVPAIGGEG